MIETVKWLWSARSSMFQTCVVVGTLVIVIGGFILGAATLAYRLDPASAYNQQKQFAKFCNEQLGGKAYFLNNPVCVKNGKVVYRGW